MAAVDVRRRPKPDQRLKHRETRHLPIARQRGDIFENLAIADIGRFVCVDPQQLSSVLTHYASPPKGAVSSPCGVLPSSSVWSSVCPRVTFPSPGSQDKG